MAQYAARHYTSARPSDVESFVNWITARGAESIAVGMDRVTVWWRDKDPTNPADRGYEPAFDTVGFVMAFENGELDREQVLEGFQHLVDTGIAWQLQGSYGRTAQHLIDQGLITPRA